MLNNLGLAYIEMDKVVIENVDADGFFQLFEHHPLAAQFGVLKNKKLPIFALFSFT